MNACAACGTPLEPAHRFCPGCGRRLDAEAPAAELRPKSSRRRTALHAEPPPHILSERKHVTVLMADLCDSTAQVAGADPEEARSYLDGALRLMSDVVEAYGGTVNQHRGDGLVALFGAPLAQEDHALRACLAAITMQQRSRDARAGAVPRPMVLRAGIASGEVIVGLAGDHLSAHYRADGPAIHLAARLEALARPGGVLISDATFRLSGDRLEATPLGLREIRGFDKPIALHELSLSSERSAAAPLARRRLWASLVGRGGALAELQAVVGQVRGGRMRVLGMRGEAGVGKSRLIAELCAGPHLAGFGICTVHARAYTSRNPYSVAADLMRSLMRVPGDIELEARGDVLRAAVAGWSESGSKHRVAATDLLDLGAPDEDWLSLNPAQRRRRIVDALHWLILQWLGSGPLLLVIEDIFLADRDSQRLLESLVRRLEGKPMLLCASYREDFEHRWADVAWFVEHWLAPLQATDMHALARSMLGPHESLDGVIAELIERADGNPFFLEQLAITLIDDGSLIGPPGGYRLAHPHAELRVPPSIAAVIGARVDRLPAAAKASLEAAAILGEPISGQLIGAMQGQSAPDAEAHLLLGVASGLLIAPAMQGSGAVYSFRHALVQEVLLAALTRPRRKSLHRSAFGALRDRLGEQAVDWASTLTHHAFYGEQWPDAAGYAVKSMARAVARSANREALRLFELGLDAARRTDGEGQALPLELSLRLEAIGALMPLGQIDAIVSNLERSDEIARLIGDQRRMATVSLQMAVFFWMRGRFSKGLVYATQAREAGVAAGRRKLQMAAVQVQMMMNHGLGRYREAAEHARHVEREYADELRGRRILAGWATVPAMNLHSFLASALWRQGDVRGAQAVCDEAYRQLADFDHPYSRGLIDFAQGQIWVERGRLPEAVALLRDSARSCEVNDIPTMVPVIVSLLGGALARNGDASEGVALLEKAFANRVHAAGGAYGELFLRHNLGVALMRAGRHAEAVEWAQSAVDFAAAGEQHGHQAEALFGLAEALLAAGRPESALRCFKDTEAQAQRCSMPFFVERSRECIAQLEAVASHET